jgi:hypothetical protein
MTEAMSVSCQTQTSRLIAQAFYITQCSKKCASIERPVQFILDERIVAPTRFLWRLLVERARKVQAMQERYRAFTGEDAHEARGITLLRE